MSPLPAGRVAQADMTLELSPLLVVTVGAVDVYITYCTTVFDVPVVSPVGPAVLALVPPVVVIAGPVSSCSPFVLK